MYVDVNMPQYVNYELNMKDIVFKRAISPEIIQQVHQFYKMNVNSKTLEQILEIFGEKHDLWFDDVLDLVGTDHPEDAGSFFALKYAFRAEDMVALESPYLEQPNEYHTERIINRLRKHGCSQWA